MRETTKAEGPAHKLPPGITVTGEATTGVEYVGSESALLAAKLSELGWLQGLGGHCRQIARLPNGGWQIVGEGKGNRLTNAHKEAGAYSVSPRRDGLFTLFVYRHPAEYRALYAAGKAARDAEYAAWREEERAAAEKRIWQRGKAVHQGDAATNALHDYSRAIAERIHALRDLIAGQAYYDGLPRIGYAPGEAARARALLGELTALLQHANPVILDRQRENNVYRLDGSAYIALRERA